MLLPIADIIQIAKISQFLAANSIAKGTLFSPRIDPKLAQTLYMERKAVEWGYNIDPSYASLRQTANYLYALCGGLALKAQEIINQGGSVSPVNPLVSNIYPFIITSANFEPDGVSYNNPLIVGDNLSIFIDEYNQQWLTAPASFIYTSTGIQITAPGFDANSNSYTIMIQKLNS